MIKKISKKTLLILVVSLIPTIVMGRGWNIYGIGYNEGTTIKDIDLMKYDKTFTSDNLTENNIGFKINNYRFFIGNRDKFIGNIELEYRGIVEHYNLHSKSIIDAKCLVAPGAELVVAPGSPFNGHIGLSFCDSQLGMSEVYVLESDSPKRNPYVNSMHKYHGGVAFNFEMRRWGFRLMYNFTQVKLYIRETGVSQDLDFQTYGVEVYSL